MVLSMLWPLAPNSQPVRRMRKVLAMGRNLGLARCLRLAEDADGVRLIAFQIGAEFVAGEDLV